MESINKILGHNSFDLILLLLEEEKLHLRGIAEKLNLAASTVHFLLNLLKDREIVIFEKKKNFVLFSLNKKNPILKEILTLIFVEKIVSSKAFSEFIKMKPLYIGLYGSLARGELTKNSDIDLFILFKNKKPSVIDIQLANRNLSKILGKEVNVSSFDEKKFRTLKQSDLVYYNELFFTSKALFGELVD